MLNSKQKCAVDYRIDEHTTNEEFIGTFYSNIVLNSKQRFRVDEMIAKHTTKK